jgi:hypothetical protein
MQTPKYKKYINFLGYAFIFTITLGTIELMAYVTCRYLANNNRGLYMACITQSFEDHKSKFNPVLGWSISQDPSFYDEAGSRQIPAFSSPSQNRTYVSLYGDSFTEGVGVSHQQAWSNILSELLGCQVANYGVAGYGSDQAYLRYSYNRNDKAKIVILSHMSQNIARNVNELRNFIASGSACELKPRFFLNSKGKLELVPVPKLSESDYYDLEKHPKLYLKHDYFIPEGPSGIKFASFPYIITMIRASKIIIQRVILNPTYWRDLYDREHPSQALLVTVAIMNNFCKEARYRRQYPIIFILPTLGDLRYYKLHNNSYYQPLIDALKRQGIQVIDIAKIFTQRLPNIDQSALFSKKSQYHYSPFANRILAEIAADFISERKLLDVSVKTGFPNVIQRNIRK